jgi:hypothetical protein
MDSMDYNRFVTILTEWGEYIQCNFSDGQTMADILSNLRDSRSWEYKSTPQLRDTTQGTILSGQEAPVPGRLYYLSGWITTSPYAPLGTPLAP